MEQILFHLKQSKIDQKQRWFFSAKLPRDGTPGRDEQQTDGTPGREEQQADGTPGRERAAS